MAALVRDGRRLRHPAARVPVGRLVPVPPERPAGRRPVLGRGPLPDRLEPARPRPADGVRRLHAPEPGHVRGARPGGLELDPPVHDRRRAAPVARRQRQPAALVADARAAARARARAPAGPGRAHGLLGLVGSGHGGELLAAGGARSCRPAPTSSTAPRWSPPRATGRRSISPSAASHSRAGGSARTTSPRTRCSTSRRSPRDQYQAWLRSVGVRYVMLPHAPLDYSSITEARLLRSGRSGLRLVRAAARLDGVRAAAPDADPDRRPAGARREACSA